MGSITILVDSRENYPLPFPGYLDIGTHFKPYRVAIKTKTVALEAGDYCLEESPKTCIIERKASRNELATNLFDPKDQIRAMKAFRRLGSATTNPVLLLEVSPHELFISPPRGRSRVPLADVTGDELLQRICALSAKLGLSLMWFSRQTNRRLIGTIAAHVMLSHALENNPNFLKGT